jgi:hypothetical protein
LRMGVGVGLRMRARRATSVIVRVQVRVRSGVVALFRLGSRIRQHIRKHRIGDHLVDELGVATSVCQRWQIYASSTPALRQLHL